MNGDIEGFIFIALGALTMLGAALNWGVVSRPGKLFNRIAGDTLARTIYFLAGVLLFVAGIGRLIGANWI